MIEKNGIISPYINQINQALFFYFFDQVVFIVSKIFNRKEMSLKVFIISLKGAIERREQMQRQIIKLHKEIEFCFFDAIESSRGGGNIKIY